MTSNVRTSIATVLSGNRSRRALEPPNSFLNSVIERRALRRNGSSSRVAALQTSNTALLGTPRLQVKNVSAIGSTTHKFRVAYSSLDRLKRATLSSKRIGVSGPNGFNQVARLVKATFNRTGRQATATYQVGAPGGQWEPLDNGKYIVALREGRIGQRQRSFSNKRLGSFQANLVNAKPTATLLPGNFTGRAAYTFAVTYRDDIAIDPSSIDSKDILVTGPQGYSQFATVVGLSADSDGSQTAIYRIFAPNAAWTDSADGTYAIALQPNEVSDRFGSVVDATPLGSFAVTARFLPPTASLLTTNALLGATSHAFTVTYEDNGVVDFMTLDSQDIRVKGPNGFNQLAAYRGVDVNTGVANYEVLAPNGGWSDANSGIYTVSLEANQVGDTVGNFSPTQDLGVFQVAPFSLRIEAETMTLSNYFVESRSFLSGGKMIRVEPHSNSFGSASKLFGAPSGVYEVVLGYFDESDGKSQLSVRVGSTVLESWRLDDPTGSKVVNTVEDYLKTFRLRTVGSKVNIRQGDRIEILGTAKDGEGSRVDYLEFRRIG